MVGYNTRDWAPLLPEALYYYNFQHKNRAIGNLRPAQVDNEEEENIASRFKKERSTWSRVPFTISKSVAGPSLNVTHPQEPFPKQRKVLPYNLRWT